MPIQNRELYTSQTDTHSSRTHAYEGGTRPATFLNISSGPTLPYMTPLVKHTGVDKLRAWTDADASSNPIVAFVYPYGAALHATNDTIHTVMTKGRIHREDIPLPATMTLATLNAALSTAGVLSQGFDIYAHPQAGIK